MVCTATPSGVVDRRECLQTTCNETKRSNKGANVPDRGQVMASVAVIRADPKQSEERPKHESVALPEEIDEESMSDEIVGSSGALQKVLSLVSKVAPTDATVLATGETGTGKELVARTIHPRAPPSSRVFVSVNCAAIPRDLIASELFGQEKGSFTGAVQRRLGR